MSESGDLQCAVWARDFGVDPIATVGTYRSFLLVELPLPWPRDLADLDQFKELIPVLKAANCRLQAVVVPRGIDERRLSIYWTSGDKFSYYHLLEIVVPLEDIVEAAAKLVQDAALKRSEPDDHPDTKHVLVCTHGKRDRCCGSNGTSLALDLQRDAQDRFSGAQIDRTSHTGGHRFAPTSLIFPDGTGWAYCDVELIERISNREGPISRVLPHYRGCAGLRSRGAQTLERSVLAELGWNLFDLKRQGHDEGDGRVSLDVEWPDGEIARWEATLVEGRRIPVPDCGRPLGEAKKFESEVALEGVRRTR